MKRTFFHGTTADNLKRILRDGLDPHAENKVWTVSDRGVYLWSPDELAKQGDTDEEYKMEYAKDQAYSSAQMGLGMAKDCRCVVFEIELDESEVEEDTSCENMGGAVVCFDVIPLDKVKSIWISPDLSLLKGYFIALALGRDMFAGEFTRLETQIGEMFGKAEIYFEAGEYPLEPYKMPRRKAVRIVEERAA